MNKNRMSSLVVMPRRTAAVAAFYDRYRERIAGIKTVQERNSVLSDMQQYLETEIRQKPQNRNQLSEIYELLKQKCWEVSLFGSE